MARFIKVTAAHNDERYRQTRYIPVVRIRELMPCTPTDANVTAKTYVELQDGCNNLTYIYVTETCEELLAQINQPHAVVRRMYAGS